MRLIDADEALRLFDNDVETMKTKIEGKVPFQVGAAMVSAAKEIRTSLKETLDKTPTLDYEPVRHGYWKHETPTKDDGQKPFVCSECGLRHPRYGDTDKAYFTCCPWCGDRMDAMEDADENA